MSFLYEAQGTFEVALDVAAALTDTAPGCGLYRQLLVHGVLHIFYWLPDYEFLLISEFDAFADRRYLSLQAIGD